MPPDSPLCFVLQKPNLELANALGLLRKDADSGRMARWAEIASGKEMTMNEEPIRQLIERYFTENAAALQEELKELQKDYVRRKLQEQHKEWGKDIQEQDDQFFKEITELLKAAYK